LKIFQCDENPLIKLFLLIFALWKTVEHRNHIENQTYLYLLLYTMKSVILFSGYMMAAGKNCWSDTWQIHWELFSFLWRLYSHNRDWQRESKREYSV